MRVLRVYRTLPAPRRRSLVQRAPDHLPMEPAPVVGVHSTQGALGQARGAGPSHHVLRRADPLHPTVPMYAELQLASPPLDLWCTPGKRTTTANRYPRCTRCGGLHPGRLGWCKLCHGDHWYPWTTWEYPCQGQPTQCTEPPIRQVWQCTWHDDDYPRCPDCPHHPRLGRVGRVFTGRAWCPCCKDWKPLPPHSLSESLCTPGGTQP